MTLSQALIGLVSALLIAAVTTPAGVSGAVFLLPVQLSVLDVPNPAVTPTNLLFNVVGTPGALLRYRRHGQLDPQLTRRLIAGTLPGVVAGSAVHVYFAAGPRTFRVLAAAVLLPLGVWLIRRRRPPAAPTRTIPPRGITALSLVVGFVGGIYGIGGGSILAPVLVGSGLPVTTVAPAALASTFFTSLAGAVTYAVLALTTSGAIAPNWSLGITCGVGGLIGGYLGARLQGHFDERALRTLLGTLAIALAVAYLAQVAI